MLDTMSLPLLYGASLTSSPAKLKLWGPRGAFAMTLVQLCSLQIITPVVKVRAPHPCRLHVELGPATIANQQTILLTETG